MSNAQTLYETLFETLQGVKNGTVSLEKAKAMSEIAQTITNVAKVEVDYIRQTQSKSANFFKPSLQAPKAPMVQGAASQVEHIDSKTITPEIYQTAAGNKVEKIGNVTRHTAK